MLGTLRGFRRVSRAGAVAAFVLGLLGTCTPDAGDGRAPLIVDFVPRQASPVDLEAVQPVAEVLARRLGVPVLARIPATYADADADLLSGAADAAWLTPLDYAVVDSRIGLEPLLQSSRGGVDGRGLVIARRGAGIAGLRDLRGHSLALGRAGSLAANLYPRYYLARNRIDLRRDLSRLLTLDSDAQVAVSVCMGSVDAGAIFEDARRLPGLDQACAGIVDDTVVVFTTPAIPSDSLVVRSGLSAQRRARLRTAVVASSADQSFRSLLSSLYAIDHTQPAHDADYQRLMGVVRAVDPRLLHVP